MTIIIIFIIIYSINSYIVINKTHDQLHNADSITALKQQYLIELKATNLSENEKNVLYSEFMHYSDFRNDIFHKLDQKGIIHTNIVDYNPDEGLSYFTKQVYIQIIFIIAIIVATIIMKITVKGDEYQYFLFAFFILAISIETMKPPKIFIKQTNHQIHYKNLSPKFIY